MGKRSEAKLKRRKKRLKARKIDNLFSEMVSKMRETFGDLNEILSEKDPQFAQSLETIRRLEKEIPDIDSWDDEGEDGNPQTPPSPEHLLYNEANDYVIEKRLMFMGEKIIPKKSFDSATYV